MCVVCLFSVTAAHSMMQKRLTKLVVESFGVQSYKKAMDCLTLLRAESIKVCMTSKEESYCPVYCIDAVGWATGMAGKKFCSDSSQQFIFRDCFRRFLQAFMSPNKQRQSTM